MLGNFPWGWFLLGVGILILATQFARWLMGMKSSEEELMAFLL